MATTGLESIVKTRGSRTNIIITSVFLIIIVIFGLIVLGPSGGLHAALLWFSSLDLVVYWLTTMVLMVALLGLIGRATNQHWLGVLIDSTNTMSLARLQVALWTVLVLSAYLIFAMPRIFSQMTQMDKLDKNDPLMQQCLKDKPSNYVPTMEGCDGGALQITFPPELVLAMGISLTSFAGSHLIQSVKSTRILNLTDRQAKVREAEGKLETAKQNYDTAVKDAKTPLLKLQPAQQMYDTAEMALKSAPSTAPNRNDLENAQKQAKLERDAANRTYEDCVAKINQAQSEVDAATRALDNAKREEQAARTEAEGVLHKNDSPAQAHLSEIFRGAEISNYMQVDMGKVQMSFFTLVVLLAYGAAIAALLRNSTAMLHPLGLDFPPFSDSLNALLGISHGAYLTAKATTQS